MILRFWGVRGSFAVNGPKYKEFGSATSCASIEVAENEFIVIDAGTGIREFGEFFNPAKPLTQATLFLTHFHLDHVMGFPSFQPLYDPDFLLILYSSLSPGDTQAQIDRLMGGRFFPVSFSETACQKEIRRLENRLTLNHLTISSVSLPHPQGNMALRFEIEGKSIVFATDAEPQEDIWSQEIIYFASGATYLVGDATFTPEEYVQGRKGWGHASWRAAVKLAREAGCENLILSHWNPAHEDRKIKEIIKQARREFQRTLGAKPGLEINF